MDRDELIAKLNKEGIFPKKYFFPIHRMEAYKNIQHRAENLINTEFIADNISKSNDLIVCFNNELLFGSGDWGHVCVIQGIDRNVVMLIDPERSVPKKRRTELPNLIEAIKKHGEEKRGGFWVIS